MQGDRCTHHAFTYTCTWFAAFAVYYSSKINHLMRSLNAFAAFAAFALKTRAHHATSPSAWRKAKTPSVIHCASF
jgi:hypothetical protein